MIKYTTKGKILFFILLLINVNAAFAQLKERQINTSTKHYHPRNSLTLHQQQASASEVKTAKPTSDEINSKKTSH